MKKYREINEKISEYIVSYDKEVKELLTLARDNNQKLYRMDWEPNQNIRKKMYDIATFQTAEYVMKHMMKVKAFNYPLDILTYAIEQVTLNDGLYLEFGVYSGRTINHIASYVPDKIIYGFDSFEGLPETWRSGYEKGTFAVTTLPEVKDNVKLIVGLFEDKLHSFKVEYSNACAFIHIDCDLYSSTAYVLEELEEQIQEGTIIVFDEYFNYPGWQDGEYKAFQEFVKKYQIKYEYIAYVEILEQVAVKIIEKKVGK